MQINDFEKLIAECKAKGIRTAGELYAAIVHGIIRI